MIAFMGLKFMYISTVNKFLNSYNWYDYVKDTNAKYLMWVAVTWFSSNEYLLYSP